MLKNNEYDSEISEIVNNYSKKSELQSLKDCVEKNGLIMAVQRKVSYQIQIHMQIKVELNSLNACLKKFVIYLSKEKRVTYLKRVLKQR